MNTAATRYLLAKYIPDMQRMEPRNIGVILWSPDGIEARFLAENRNRLGEVDGRTMGAFVPDAGAARAFRQWIRFWRAAVSAQTIEPVMGGDPIPRSSEAFLDALKDTSNGNFIVVDGGVLWEPVELDFLPDLADHFFISLVETKASDEARDPGLDERVESIIAATPLQNDPFFLRSHEIQCTVKVGAVENFEFNYAYANGSLQRLYHRVPFASRQRRTVKKTVDATAWMFDRVIDAKMITRDQGAVLVHVSEEQRADEEVARHLHVLGAVTRVLDVGDPDPISKEFRGLPLLAKH